MTLLSQLNQIIENREDNYDNPLPNFLRISLLWSVWKGEVLDPYDVIFMMDLMKTARQIHNHSDDTLLDKTGYTVSCYERINDLMNKMGYKDGIEEFRSWKNTLEFCKNDPNDYAAVQGNYFGWMFTLLLNSKRFMRENE